MSLFVHINNRYITSYDISIPVYSANSDSGFMGMLEEPSLKLHLTPNLCGYDDGDVRNPKRKVSKRYFHLHSATASYSSIATGVSLYVIIEFSGLEIHKCKIEESENRKMTILGV